MSSSICFTNASVLIDNEFYAMPFSFSKGHIVASADKEIDLSGWLRCLQEGNGNPCF